MLLTRSRREIAWRWNKKPPMGSRLNTQHPLYHGLTAYYLLNEGTGKTCFDLTGQYLATATATTWSNDNYGTVLNVAAIQSHSPISINAINSAALPATIVAWGTASSVATATAAIFALGSFFYLRSPNPGQMDALYNGSGAIAPSVVDTNLHMWAATNTGVTNGLILYKDGLKVATGTGTLAAISSLYLQLGGSTTVNFWNGTVAGPCAFWLGRALTAGNVMSLYKNRWGMILPPAHYRG